MKWVQKKGARRRGKKKISKLRRTTTLTPPQKTFFLLSLLLEGTIAGFIVPISRECTFSPKPRRRECEGVRAKGRPRGSEGASKNRAIAAAAAESIIGHRSLVLLPDSGLLLHRDGMDLLRCLGNRGRMGDSLPWAARRAMKRRASHRRPTAAAAAGPQSTLQLAPRIRAAARTLASCLFLLDGCPVACLELPVMRFSDRDTRQSRRRLERRTMASAIKRAQKKGGAAATLAAP